MHRVGIVELVLDLLELPEVGRRHQHRFKVLFLIPEVLLHLLSFDGLEFVVAELCVELRVGLESSTDEFDATR